MSKYDDIINRLHEYIGTGSMRGTDTARMAVELIETLEKKINDLEAKMKKWKTIMNVSYGEKLR